jgi:uncharacterized coiled-coil protein SlyX
MPTRPESRIKSLEHRATDIEADIEELSDDMAEGFKDLKQSDQQILDRMNHGFEQAVAFIKENTVSKEELKIGLEALENRIMENLGTFKREVFEQLLEQKKQIDLLVQLFKKEE